MAKDPILLAGEKREDPKSEMMPVTEATPQFKNFFIKNTYVNGAEKALFIRGLPEMNIKNINIENSVIQADAGIELVEAQGISIKNMSLLTRKSSNLISIRNSSAVNFDGFKALSNYQSFAEIAGAKTANINFINTPIKDAKQKSTFTFGAKPSVLNIK